jgi:hypothetical protein
MFVFVANSNIQFLKFYYLLSIFLVGAILNTDGALRFPVFHRDHPLLPSWIQSSNIPDATVIRGDSLREVVFFVAISLGTPAVHNLVTIDAGSSLSWVQW